MPNLEEPCGRNNHHQSTGKALKELIEFFTQLKKANALAADVAQTEYMIGFHQGKLKAYETILYELYQKEANVNPSKHQAVQIAHYPDESTKQ
jgi:hypothetical protein